MEKPSVFEEKKTELNQMVENVRQRAISFARANEILDTLQSSTSQEEIDILNSELKESTVTVQTLPEFKILLQDTGLNEEEILHTLEHENAHANVAEIVGAEHKGYSLLICKNGNDFMYNAWASFAHPIDWFTNEKKVDIKRIFAAPEEYGNSLSESDKENLRQLEGEE